MILRLRKKFIVIAMTSMIAVLGVIVVSMNLINYANVLGRVRQRMTVLSENGGRFPKDGEGRLKPKQAPVWKNEKESFMDFYNSVIDPETPFETRFFTVSIREDGEVVAVDTGNIASIETGEAAEYAVGLLEEDESEGFLEHYRYLRIKKDGKWMYIFLDCHQELSSFYSFMFISIIISLAAILLVFFFVVFFSKLAVRPIVENYNHQREFITNASHELKTPLAVINAATEVVELDYGESEWTKSIHNQVERLSGLTEQLVFLAKTEEQSEQAAMEKVNLSKVVLDSAEAIRPMAETGNKQLILDVAEHVVVRGNGGLISQLLTQLFDNAIKYTDENGRIKVELTQNGKHIDLLMKNTCENVEAGEQNVLFERFHRSDTSRNSKTGGHGIGLSVVKAITDLHKWEITARSDGESMSLHIKMTAFKG